MSDLPTVWLVEDSRLEAEQALRALSGEYAVELFPDGPSLIERLEGGALPLLLILDQNLPGMTGLEVCQFVRQRRDERELPIIMVTSVAEKASVVAALSSGASDYLTKPYDPEELRARVRTQARSP